MKCFLVIDGDAVAFYRETEMEAAEKTYARWSKGSPNVMLVEFTVNEGVVSGESVRRNIQG